MGLVVVAVSVGAIASSVVVVVSSEVKYPIVVSSIISRFQLISLIIKSISRRIRFTVHLSELSEWICFKYRTTWCFSVCYWMFIQD